MFISPFSFLSLNRGEGQVSLNRVSIVSHSVSQSWRGASGEGQVTDSALIALASNIVYMT
jgi:hypothetical protein